MGGGGVVVDSKTSSFKLEDDWESSKYSESFWETPHPEPDLLAETLSLRNTYKALYTTKYLRSLVPSDQPVYEVN